MSTDRFEFTKTQKREMASRSNGVCEAGKFGTFKFYGMADADICHREAQEFDHIIADGLKRQRPTSIDEGLHVCQIHHKIKTHAHDRPKIQKAKDIREKRAGITNVKRPLPGSKASGWKKTMSGEVVRR
jgi:hypothetical protein